MTWHFQYTPGVGETEITVVDEAGNKLSYERWAIGVPDALLPGLDLIQRFVASDNAVDVGDVVLLKSSCVAALSTREAAHLSFPPLIDAQLRLQAQGLITQPSYKVSLDWMRPNGQPLVSQRVGAWLRVGAEFRRLPEILYAVSEAIDALNSASFSSVDERLKALAQLREVLPHEAANQHIQARGLIGAMTIAVADSFSVDLVGEDKNQQLVPKLHGAKGELEDLLLNDQQQTAFEARFFSASHAQPVYSIGGQHYVVLQPPLRKALGEVRKLSGGTQAAKRAFLANPRSYLRDALGADVEDVVLENVFRETNSYSQRVQGLGLWIPRVVPWIKLPSTDWLGGVETGGELKQKQEKVPLGLIIGERTLPLSEEAAGELREQIEQSIAAGEKAVQVATPEGPITIPANEDTLRAIHALELELFQQKGKEQKQERKTKGQQDAIIIHTNEGDIEIEADVARDRRAPSSDSPACLKTSLKVHQSEGLRWLQASYVKGAPGVLLADDMGLGKTLQGLAFLAWLKAGMNAGIVQKAPLLIVAPTGLLANWRAEHDKHLASPGLGNCTEAFGKGLATLKATGADGRPSLNPKALEQADWVMTTYETLRDYDKDFGQVQFAAALFDEAQKIKTPGVRITDAAKGMNCTFRVALTGTPVENRLADLWCIIDGVHPGLLGDLKSFSETFEKELDPDRLKRLKQSLEKPYGGRPQIMLRRMKHDKLPDLPLPNETLIRSPMPRIQREAYHAAIAQGKDSKGKGAMLETLQKLRSISLHPDAQAEMRDDEFIDASARLKAAFDSLDKIAAQGEKALIFLEDLDLQARLVGILQRRYKLPFPPAVINGSVDGSKRQARVDAFQAAPDGFDVMLLSPRAGGVGLTLTRANHAIHLSRWWNPAVEDQCTGRILRIGQPKQVYIHVPLAVVEEGLPCFDENLHRLLQRKRQLMHDTLAPPDATAMGDMDELFRATVG